MVCLISILLYSFLFLRGKLRVYLLVFLVGLGATASLTDNRVSRKFGAMISQTENRFAHGYIFDRASFWHAFSLMIRERPLFRAWKRLGH